MCGSVHHTWLAFGSYPPATVGPHGSHTRCLGTFTLLKTQLFYESQCHDYDIINDLPASFFHCIQHKPHIATCAHGWCVCVWMGDVVG